MRLVLSALAVFLLSLPLTSSQPKGPDYWRHVFSSAPAEHAYSASFHGVGEASHFVAERYWQQQQRAQALAYYQRAVNQGDAGAAYVMAQRVPAQREQWLRAAAELGDPRATEYIAEQLQHSDPLTAITLLSDLPADKDSRNELLAHLLFNHPYLVTAAEQSWQILAPSSPVWRERRQIADEIAAQGHLSIARDGQCEVLLTLYYHGHEARSSTYDWLAGMREHPFSELGLCFAEAGLVATSDYVCAKDEAGRMRCQGSAQVDTAELSVHITQRGGATARQHTITIAQSASLEVLVHELGHLFSLADEYPMPADLAAAFCAGRFRFASLNIVVTPREKQLWSRQELDMLRTTLPWAEYLEQPIGLPVARENGEVGYQLGSASAARVGLFAADTCKGTEYQAWRPVAGITFMQQHEVGSVPPVYIELMRDYLQRRQ